MKRHNSKPKIIISSIFAFLLTLLILVLNLCLGFCFSVFSKRTIISKINESGYYNKVYNQIIKDNEIIVQKAGFPVSVLDNVITFDDVYINGKNYIINALAGKKVQVDTDKLCNKLTDNINHFLTVNKIDETDKLSTGIGKLVSKIKDEYKSNVELQFINYYVEYRNNFFDLMMIILPVIIILISILCYFLIRIHKHKHRGLRYITYALIASSCMTMIMALYLMLSKWYRKIDVTPDYYRIFLISCLKWDIMVFIYLGGIGLILSFILISLTGFMRNKISQS